MAQNTPLLTTQFPEEEYLTADQLAEKLQISRSTIEKRTARREVPGQVQIGRVWRYFLPIIEKRLGSGQQFFIPSKPDRVYAKPALGRLAVAEDLPPMYKVRGK